MSNTQRTILTEKSEPLKYIKESGTREDGKHYLGKLAGPAADWTKSTRNNRRYPYELWVNVENSDDFKEGMSTLTIFGEADHPETRVDTSIKEIAIVMTKYELRKDEGIVYAEFDILDTPNGRILKELCDYGSKIGVSSRGLGDEIVKDGETIIDPDTYLFYGFDAVVMPAVVSARPTVIESINIDSKNKNLLESFNREIDNASSESELNSIKKIAESINLPNLDSIKESINNKLSSYNTGEDISALRTDLDNSLEENKILKDKIAKLESKLTAKDIRLKKIRSQMSKVTESSTNMRKLLMQTKLELKDRDTAIIEDSNQIEELTDCLENTKISYNNKISRLSNHNRMLSKQLESKKSSIDKLLSQKSNLESKIESYNSRSRALESDNQKLRESNSNLVKQLESIRSSQKLIEKNSNRDKTNLTEQLTKSKAYSKEATDKYLDIKCRESNIDIQTAKYNLPKSYSIEDIDKVVEKLADRKQRLSKVPFVIQPNSITINEVRSSNASPEEYQTMTFLENASKVLKS